MHGSSVRLPSDVDAPVALMYLIRRAVCPECGERIGVYEPTLVVASDGRSRISSLAREPDLLDSAHRMFHASCANRASSDPLDSE